MKTQLETELLPAKSSFLSDFLQLTKMRLALSVVFSSLAGYGIAADQFDMIAVMCLFIGGYAMVGASNAYNQILEKDLDALMQRTKNRPIPSGRMDKTTAQLIAVSLTLIGALALMAINTKTAVFGMLSVLMYVCFYTPLKTKTPLSVFIGAIPGAIPFMLGWVAHTGSFGIEPGVLFMVQFFWQFPHFWAIGWQLEEDYKKAGFKMLPTGKADQATAFQIVFYILWTIILSITPYTVYTGTLSISLWSCVALVALGIGFLYFGLRLMRFKTPQEARKLTYASIAYMTLVQLIYVIDKFIF